jgi:hypothetical protein
MATGMLARLNESQFWRNPRKRLATVAISIVLMAAMVGSSAWLSFRSNGPGSGDTQWMCQNGHQFTITARQLNDLRANHYGEQVKCPECGAPALPAYKCPHCGNLIAPGASRICPVCKQPLK